MFETREKRLGELLIDLKLINSEQLDSILNIQKTSGKKLGELLIDEGLVSEKHIIEVLEYKLKIPRIDFNSFSISPEAIGLINESLARRHGLIPVGWDDARLVVAMTDPLDLYAIDDVSMAAKQEIKPLLASKTEVFSAIDRYYGKESAEKAVEDFANEYHLDEINDMESDQLSEINNAPVVRFVNSIIQHAVKVSASDIHIEPYENNLRIRFRMDGELQEIMKSAKTPHSAIVTRIKIMGRMDIAEKRIPQDGRVETTVDGKDVDLRISILPTIYGEKVVIRLLLRNSIILNKSQLGFTDENIKLFDRILHNPNGIILVTGPTGSGKTTTLYAVLRELNKISRNIITVEDPVEYRLDGINQVQVNNKAGLTFADGLRSILRQDPDIIMIGEIRDVETAQIAVRASITGHLVLSTMHTNDCASTVSRLTDMGIEPYLVSSSVVGIIAQRLVRRICTNCRTAYKPDYKELELLKLRDVQLLYKGKGCSACANTGYKGRTSLHEVMPIARELRELINRRASIDQIRNVSVRHGTTTLRENCLKLVLSGTTTTEELIRVTYTME